VDSLNNFFDKAGQKTSELFLGKGGKVPNNHSGKYVGPGDSDGINRTSGSDFTSNPNPSPGQKSPASSLSENGISYPAGFTPISYYKSPSGEIIVEPVGNPIEIESKFKLNRESYFEFNDYPTSDFKFGLEDESNSSNWPGESIPYNMIGSKNDRESFDGSYNKKPWEKSAWWSGGEGTPYENEDPVYFGFEIEIDAINSPLINGQARTFIETFGGTNLEVSSRLEILDSFIHELSKYFVFNTTNKTDNLESIFRTKINKKHYVKKVDGIDKLIEYNGPNPSTTNAFTKYKTDTIKLSFYEDTNLSSGALASLYKLLYWSRIHGKNILPENLLRFDCKLVVSEARNIARVRRALGSPEPNLEVIKENVSRYVYNIYECQFVFAKMTHPNSIDLSQNPSYSDNWDIEFTFKFADMKYERFIFENNFGSYKRLDNSNIDPLSTTSINANSAVLDTDGILPISSEIKPIILEPIIDGYNGFFDSSNTDDPSDILKNAKKNNLKSRLKSALGDAGDKLITNLKRAALSEAQRQLNDQFRLLNNTIDKVRTSYGIGRMSEPTNVYNNPPGGQFFFDVHNSLRNFAGDTLTGLLNKR